MSTAGSTPPNLVGQFRCAGGEGPRRPAARSTLRTTTTPVYVHASGRVDDVWAAVGSANLNRRSWSHDSELTLAVLDEHRDGRPPTHPADHREPARRFARELRSTAARASDRAADDDANLVDR
jgi:phosphatidylserine/phosphatidylglycerophosphate/cardiolipin synthase-like enzyme